MMSSDKNASPQRSGSHLTSPPSRARYRLLCSLLTTYAYGLVGLAVAPTLIPVQQPPVWVTIGELVTSMLLLALAWLIAPRAVE
jgi:hypothetical protein